MVWPMSCTCNAWQLESKAIHDRLTSHVKQRSDTGMAGLIPCDLGLIGGTIGMGIMELIGQTVLPAEVVVDLLAICQCLTEGQSESLRLTRLVLVKPVL